MHTSVSCTHLKTLVSFEQPEMQFHLCRRWYQVESTIEFKKWLPLGYVILGRTYHYICAQITVCTEILRV